MAIYKIYGERKGNVEEKIGNIAKEFDRYRFFLTEVHPDQYGICGIKSRCNPTHEEIIKRRIT